MAPTRQARKIALVGASGNVGQHTLRALLSFGVHEITLIVRPESESSFPEHETIVKRASYDDHTALTSALEGCEVLIIQLGITSVHHSGHYIRAAAAAGVHYVLPVEFGSDPDAKLMAELPEIAAKREWRQLIEDLGVSSWIGVITNPWYDYCLPLSEVIGIDAVKKSATLWDGGDIKMSFSTLPRVGRITAELVSLPDPELQRYRNKYFFVSAFHVTQRQILHSVVKATSTELEEWTMEVRPSDDYIASANSLPDSDLHAKTVLKFFPLHFKAGYGGNLEDKVEDLTRFGMDKEEDLDEVTAAVLQRTYK